MARGYRTDGRTQRGEPVLSFHCVRCPIMTHSVVSCVRHNARVKAPRRNATRKSKHYMKVFLRTSSHVNPEYKIERELSRPADTAVANLRQSRDFRRREGKKMGEPNECRTACSKGERLVTRLPTFFVRSNLYLWPGQSVVYISVHFLIYLHRV